MSRRQRHAIAFMSAIYRNDVSRGADGNTSAGHSGSKSSNGEETNDSDGGNSGGSPAAHTHRCANCVHIRLPLKEDYDRRPPPLHCTMVNAPKYIGSYPIR